ncbi:MAG: hypothetical protein IT495_20815 [Gammaproteobacteria bacterium]|nr:hypothetical protein [Gammaproteobacteria bacterium]
MSNVTELLKRYPDVPRSVLLKMEFQRLGVDITDAAVDAAKDGNYIFKGEFQFSWDVGKRKTLNQKVPFNYRFKRDDTYFLFRTSDNTPYTVDVVDGKFVIREDEEILEEIYFEEAPPYFKLQTSDGVPMSAVAQSLGDMLFVTINKYCEIWKHGNACMYCDIMAVTKDQAKSGELGITHRTPDQIAETLNAAFRDTKPRAYRHITFSGGTITSKVRGKDDITYYADILNAVGRKIRTWYGATIQMGPPADKDGWKRIADTGIPSVQTNMEVWDQRLFQTLCPGKEKWVGHGEWIRRMLLGAEVLGPGRVIPNFVIGVEMAKPMGFTDVDAAVESTLTGWEYLMQHGVFPRGSIWLREEGSALAGQEAAPLDYYVKLGRGYKELRHKYGYGDNLVHLCRDCNPQDTLHDWDYADRQSTHVHAQPEPTTSRRTA